MTLISLTIQQSGLEMMLPLPGLHMLLGDTPSH